MQKIYILFFNNEIHSFIPQQTLYTIPITIQTYCIDECNSRMYEWHSFHLDVIHLFMDELILLSLMNCIQLKGYKEYACISCKIH
jgi:hypothetical protein